MLKKAITSVVLFVLLFSFSITSFALEYVNESYNNESDLEESIAEELPIISGRFRCDMAPYPGNE